MVVQAKEDISHLTKIDHFALYINNINILLLCGYRTFVYLFNGLFSIHVTGIASTVDDQNKFSIKTK